MRSGARLRASWLLLALGGLASWGTATGALNPRRTPLLDALPDPIGGFRTVETFAVDYGLMGEIPPETWTFRRIADEDGHEGLMYVAYFARGRRWSGRPHDVTVCYRANGWRADGADRRLAIGDGARVGVQDFVHGERRIRVFHWVQSPGLEPGRESASAYLRRLFGPQRLRQDVASVYLEFPIENAPPDGAAARAIEDLVRSLETLWTRAE